MQRRFKRTQFRKAPALKKQGMERYNAFIPFLKQISKMGEEERKLLQMKAHPDEGIQQKWNEYLTVVDSVQQAQWVITQKPNGMPPKNISKLLNIKTNVSKHHKSQAKR